MDDDDDDLITVDVDEKYAEQQQSAKEVEEQAAAEKAEQKSDLIQEIELQKTYKRVALVWRGCIVAFSFMEFRLISKQILLERRLDTQSHSLADLR